MPGAELEGGAQTPPPAGPGNPGPPAGRGIMERSQNWPDLGSAISKFRVKHLKDTGTDINR